MSLSASLRSVVVSIVLSCGVSVLAADWPQWRGPERSGVSSETGWLTGWPSNQAPQVAWSTNVGVGHSAVVVSRGLAYTMGRTGGGERVYCFDAASGTLKWSRTYAENGGGQSEGPRATPSVDGNDVFTLSQHGLLCAWNATNGQALWSSRIGVAYEPDVDYNMCWSPLVWSSYVILSAGSRGLWVNRTNGAVMRGLDGNRGTCASAAPYAGGVIIASVANSARTRDRFVGVNFAGTGLWTNEWTGSWGAYAVDPVVYGDEFFVSGTYGGNHCGKFSFTGGKQWENGNLLSQSGQCVYWSGYVYGVDVGGTLRCLSWADGARGAMAKAGFGGGGHANVIAADGKLIVLGAAGDLVVAEARPDAYVEMRRRNAVVGKTFTPPTLADGRILCRDCEGNVVCLTVRDSGLRMLTVQSERGGACPGTVMTNTGARLICAVTNSPQVLSGITQYVCRGWTLANNADTNGMFAGGGTSVTLTLTNDAVLAWQWQTNFRLNLETTGLGRLDMDDGWFPKGTSVVLTATADPLWGLVSWSGDTNACSASGATLRVPMDRARTVVANFAQVGTVQFSSATHRVGEAGSAVTVSVTRQNGEYGVVRVSYATANGTATAGADYTARSGSLSWANGDAAPKSIVIPIANDSLWEPGETFAVNLSGVTGGGQMGSPAQTVVTIENDDAPKLAAVEVGGATEAPEGTTQFYTARGIREDGSSEELTGRAAWGENSAYASISSEGRLTVSNTVLANSLCTVSASYGGRTGSASVRIQNSLRPDFRITELSLIPRQSLVAGKPFTACVTVRNDGEVSGNAGSLDIWRSQAAEVTGKLRGNKYVNAGVLGAGQSKTLTLTGLTAPTASGEYTFRAYVDSQWLTAEEDDANNQAAMSYTCKVLTNIALSAGPAVVGEGETNRYILTALWDDGSSEDVSDGAAWAAKSAYVVSAGGGWLVTASTLEAASSAFSLSASFGGRTVSRTVTVLNTMRPDFLIVDLGMSPFGPLVAGSSFAAYVTVRNDGTAAGNAGYLDVWANQPAEVTNKLQGNKYVSAGALGVGQSRTLTLSGLSAPASNGPCTLRACADSRWQAAEQSETNNQATLNYTVRSVTNLVLNGAPAVWESSGTQYGCTAFYSDGLSEDVNTRAAWSDSSSYAGIYGGYLTTKAVSANQMCTVTAAFGGRKVSAAVAILNVP